MKRGLLNAATIVSIVALVTLRVAQLVWSDEYSGTKHAISKLLPGLGVEMIGQVTVELPSGLRGDGITQAV